ncbi:LOW QUALITY PROTEIN: uncharacterized protein LOC6506264 [Drosophila ananassae]|uniref:LOW QUALITY PROTEIN: uncharacterized protein LOC6506264 n=1 Tax=Drosophila ananassae TaxID=7217 RepID=UPI001CFFB89C|nr:LOW QUALITY PROTEIN: uncharacterized protein LOC6506264 [Drosophila ananassae]
MSSRHPEKPTSTGGILKHLRHTAPLPARSESMTWLLPRNSLPIWSRRLDYNLEGCQRHSEAARWRNYDVEVAGRMWSLWGGLHPCARWFDSTVRGRQTLAVCVVACCAASTFRSLGMWSPKLLDAIVVNGDRYYRTSVEQSERWDHLLGTCASSCRWSWWPSQVYSDPASTVMGLLEGLNYFFTRYQWGVLECQEQRLAFGHSSSREGGYFIYDCSAWGSPIFPDNMGASYALRATELQVLLYCMVVTLNVRRRNVEFRLYNVDLTRVSDGPGSDPNSKYESKYE